MGRIYDLEINAILELNNNTHLQNQHLKYFIQYGVVEETKLRLYQ